MTVVIKVIVSSLKPDSNGLLLEGWYTQDHIYSQFYNAPNYLNPALNGQFEGDVRLNMIYQNQWTNTSGSLTYYYFSADYAIPQFNGGLIDNFNQKSHPH